MNRAIWGITILAVLITGTLALTLPSQWAEAGFVPEPSVNFRGENRNDQQTFSFTSGTFDPALQITITVRGPTTLRFTFNTSEIGELFVKPNGFSKLILEWDVVNKKFLPPGVWENNKGDRSSFTVPSTANDAHITAKKIAKILVEDDFSVVAENSPRGTVFLDIHPAGASP